MLSTDSLLFPELADGGLNLQALFALDQLPASLRAELNNAASAIVDSKVNGAVAEFTHVLLLGHAGTQLWRSLPADLTSQLNVAATAVISLSSHTSIPFKPTSVNIDNHTHPLDYYCQTRIGDFLCTTYPQVKLQWLYPQIESSRSYTPVNLQAFGELAGWHGDSPFRLGVHSRWGSWYAYRALLLVQGLPDALLQNNVADKLLSSSPTIAASDTAIEFADTAIEFADTAIEFTETVSACASCSDKPCITACPVGALSTNFADYNLNACIDFRLQTDSPCRHQCLARSACPVGREHQYTTEQMTYHYAVSLAMIQAWRAEKP